MSAHHGLKEIGWTRWPRHGTTFYVDFGGHDVQVYVTEERDVRLFVDNVEYRPEY